MSLQRTLKKAGLPKYWTKQHLDIYRTSLRDTVEQLAQALAKYIDLHNKGSDDVPKEMIKAHIDVFNYILKEKKHIDPNKAMAQYIVNRKNP